MVIIKFCSACDSKNVNKEKYKNINKERLVRTHEIISFFF